MSNNENPLYIDSTAFQKKLSIELIGLQPVNIGTLEAPVFQSDCGIAIGQYAGQYEQGECAIAIGKQAGETSQATQAIAIGVDAGQLEQNAYALALGLGAGNDNQGTAAIAVGVGAGQFEQDEEAIAIGVSAGQTRQSTCAIAIGSRAGNRLQRPYGIAVGYEAGYTNQGTNSIAIGRYAGMTNQPANSIVLNASGAVLSGTTKSSALYVAPIQSGVSSNVLYYDTASKEVLYGVAASGVPDGDQYSDYLFWNSDASQWNVGSSEVHLGAQAGYLSQGSGAIALGTQAGQNTQGSLAVAIGYQSGNSLQGGYAVALGALSGVENQGVGAIALGPISGAFYQGSLSIAMGVQAGLGNQGESAIAIGAAAGSFTQGYQAIAMGYYAGIESQGSNAIAIGTEAGETNQGEYAIAIGNSAGSSFQNDFALALGVEAGRNEQGTFGMAIGASAGMENQGELSVALGFESGKMYQSSNAIALGYASGYQSQGNLAIAIGTVAGEYGQGTNAIAIGAYAGQTSQPANSIVLNATGAALSGTTKSSALYVAPIQSGTTGDVLYYDSSSNEVLYGAAASGVPNGTVYSDYLFWDSNGAQWKVGSTELHLGAQAGQTGQGSYAVALGAQAGQTGQNSGAIAVGYLSGEYNQGTNAIALGVESGENNQGDNAIAIGNLAGKTNQNVEAIAIGDLAGSNNQNGYAVAIGYAAGQEAQDLDAVAIGTGAGNVAQGQQAVAVGFQSGTNQQGAFSVAIGSSGTINQGTQSVAIGKDAASNFQSGDAIAIGTRAGYSTQGSFSIAMGYEAGQYTQGTNALAIGQGSGQYGQGTNAIAIGRYAGQTNQPANSIVLNATGAALTGTTKSSALYVAPIQIGTSNNVLYYDTSSKEVLYGAASSGSGVPNGTNYSDYLFWNPTTNNWKVGSDTLHLGSNSGWGQGSFAVAVGSRAGQTGQLSGAVAVGYLAGNIFQGTNAIGLGFGAGMTGQSSGAIAVGFLAGVQTQGTNAIALGVAAGQTGQGTNSIAIGAYAGQTSQPANSIVLNATGGALAGTTKSSALYVAPIQTSTSSNLLYYDTTSNEVSYADSGQRMAVLGRLDQSGTEPTVPTAPAVPTFSGTIRYVGSTGGDFSTVALAIAAASAGDIIEIRSGYTSTETGTVTISKSLEIRGQNRSTSLIQGPATLTNPLLSVSAGVNNVYIHTATIRNNQVPSTDGGGLSSCITAATMTQAYPLGSTGLYFSDLDIIHPKVGISIQGAGFVIDNCSFTCNTATAATTVRAVINYGQTGTCFFQNSTITATTDATPRTQVMYVSANNPGFGTFVPGHTGDLVWKNITENGTCSAYYLQDVFHQPDTRNGSNYQNGPTLGGFGLWFSGCTFNGQYSGNPISFTESTSTTIAAGSNGAVLPQATINVASASAFPATGTFNVFTTAGWEVVTYTGKTATSFTGCTGGTGTLATGNNVNGLNPLSFFNVLYVKNCVGQARTTGDNKGFLAIAGSAGTNRQIGAPTTGLYALGLSNSFNSTLPSATYANGTTLTNNFLGILTTNFAAPASPLIPMVYVPSNVATTGDGASLTLGSRVWWWTTVPTAAIYSGIYTVNSGLWTRTNDFTNGLSVNSTYFWVKSGTTYGNTQWECNNAVGSDVVGTNILTWIPASVYYIPGNPSSWTGTPPTTISAALDRIAALVKTLNGGVGP